MRSVLRINRNILECKVRNVVRKAGRFFGINRNILECKGDPGAAD